MKSKDELVRIYKSKEYENISKNEAMNIVSDIDTYISRNYIDLMIDIDRRIDIRDKVLIELRKILIEKYNLEIETLVDKVEKTIQITKKIQSRTELMRESRVRIM